LMSLNRNPDRQRDYRQYYTGQTREIVARLYADDIRMLGYNFDNLSLPAVLAARNRVH
jgi:hypothetical protein